MRRRQIKHLPRTLSAPATIEELERDLLRSVESLSAGNGVDGDLAIKRLRKRMKEASGRK